MELLVELLVQSADVELPSSNNDRPLHLAASNNRKGIVEILMRCGADPSVPNGSGLLPVELTSDPLIKNLLLKDRNLAKGFSMFSPIGPIREQMAILSTEKAAQEAKVNLAQMMLDAGDSPVSSDTRKYATGEVRGEERSDTTHPLRVRVSPEGDGGEGSVAPLLSAGINGTDSSSSYLPTTDPTMGNGFNANMDRNQWNESRMVTSSDEYGARVMPIVSSNELATFSDDDADQASFTYVGIDSTKQPSRKSKAASSHDRDYSSMEGLNADSPGIYTKKNAGGSITIPKLDLRLVNNVPPPPPTNDMAFVAASSSSRNSFGSPSPREPGSSIPGVGDMIGGGAGGGVQNTTGNLTPTMGSQSYNYGITPPPHTLDSMLQAEVFCAVKETLTVQNMPDEELKHVQNFLNILIKYPPSQFDKAISAHNPLTPRNKVIEYLTIFPHFITIRFPAKLSSFVADGGGLTPMHVAAICANVELMKLLLERGGTVCVRDIQGRTPLHTCASWKNGQLDAGQLFITEEERKAAVAFLREAMSREKGGVDPVGTNAPIDVAGTTPLGCAAQKLGHNLTQGVRDQLFSPGDRSILPITPLSERTGRSPCKPGQHRETILYAYSEANGWKRGMEDMVCVSCPVEPMRPAWSFFGVLDGHGGAFSAKHLSTSLPRLLTAESAAVAKANNSAFKPGGMQADADTTPTMLEQILKTVCDRAEADLFHQPRMHLQIKRDTSGRIKNNGIECYDSSGSTAILSLITSQFIAIANVGDSRAVLARRPDHSMSEVTIASPFPQPSPRSPYGADGSSSISLSSSGATLASITAAAEAAAASGIPGGIMPSPRSSIPDLEAVALSQDHKFKIDGERERALRAGANIFVYTDADDPSSRLQIVSDGPLPEEARNAGADAFRVQSPYFTNSYINLSRSFGDFYLKQNESLPPSEQAVVATPEIYVHQRSARDAFLVLACDGVWDKMSNIEVVTFLAVKMGYTLYTPGGPVGGANAATAAEACDALLEECMRRGATDNLTVLVVILGPPPRHTATSPSSHRPAHVTSHAQQQLQQQQQQQLQSLSPPTIASIQATPTSARLAAVYGDASPGLDQEDELHLNINPSRHLQFN